MKHSTHSSRWAQATLSLVLATTLVAGAVPAAAFADTSVKVIMAAPTQVSETVNLATDTTTVLENGLVFVIDNATNTAAVTGWYGTQPAQNLALPAEIRHNAKLAEVNIAGGGGGSLHGFRF